MPRNRDTAFFGHPIGLATLFFTEMWERFSYYGARAFLMFYMTAAVSAGGRGMTVATGGLVMALYLSAVYLLSLPGGWIADRFIGQRAAVTYGGIGIALGNAMLAVPLDALFYPGLAVIALGTGLLKPNISTIVGQLYGANDVRRDSGYTIYYMGINIGAWFAPIACGFLVESKTFQGFLLANGINPAWCWNFGFAAAAVGMVAGVIQYLTTQSWLGSAGKDPVIPTDPARAARDRKVLAVILGSLGAVIAGAVVVALAGVEIPAQVITDVFGVGLVIGSVGLFWGLYRGARDDGERRRVIAMIPLFLGSIAFFGIFEQASTTLSIFARDLVDRELLGITIEASYYQSLNSIFVIVFAAVFAWMWLRLGKAGREPSDVNKFGIGMVLAAMAFVVMLPTLGAAMQKQTSSGAYLVALYFFYTCAELCISPVGLSSMSRLAPPRLAGMVMGTWFVSIANGNYLAGRAAVFVDQRGYAFLFYLLIIVALAVAVILFAVAPAIRRMMEAEKPPGQGGKPEADPELAPARVVKSGD